ncbi:hypothetical protein MMC07_009289 [Pseudocyphellaria aurata]|nr:hypothetical protein [Pseudocyphellaria aurata]
MAPKRKADTCLAGPSKKRAIEDRSEDLKRVFGKTLGAVSSGLLELGTRTAKALEENQTLLVDDGHVDRLGTELRQRVADPKETKLRLERELAVRKRDEELEAIRRQWDRKMARIEEEIILHGKVEVMQEVRTQFRKPTETEEDVRLFDTPNDREVQRPNPLWVKPKNPKVKWEPSGNREIPLFTAGESRGRFYLEAEKVWEDWCRRMDAVAPEDRGTVLPRPFKEIHQARMARLNQERELTRAAEARRVAERAAEAERLRELAKVQQRLPPIPRHPPGQHPGHRSRRGQVKWSKRTEAPPSLTRRVPMKAAAPEKPAGKGKGKGRKK